MWLLAGGLRPFPGGTDHGKLFVRAQGVKQPVRKSEPRDCRRARGEYENIAAGLPEDALVLYTDGSVMSRGAGADE